MSPSLDDVDVTGYKVYRDGSYQESVPSVVTSDTGLSPGTQYCYRISAYDAAGNESFQNGQMCATTNPPAGPQWTTRLTGTDMDFHAVHWSGTQYLAVGGEMEVFLSPDGFHWTSCSIPLATPIRLYDVAWTGAQYVGVNGWIYTSPDGIAVRSRGKQRRSAHLPRRDLVDAIETGDREPERRRLVGIPARGGGKQQHDPHIRMNL